MANIESVKLPDGTEYTIKDAAAQPATLVTPITIDGTQQTTVEGALGGLNNKGFGNRNLLINPWFTVNQRGFTSGTGTSYLLKYCVDRWKIGYGGSGGNGVVTKTTSGLHFAPSGGRLQILSPFEDASQFDGKTVTLSVLYAKGNTSTYEIVSATKTWDSSTDISFFTVTDNGYISGEYSALYGIIFSVANECTIKAVKLEKGSVSTLHLDTAPDYTTELLKCQRYFIRFLAAAGNEMLAIGYCQLSTEAKAVLFIPTGMRTNTPTVSVHGTLKVYANGSDHTVTNLGVNGNMIMAVPMWFTSSGLPAGELGIIRWSASGDYLDINAEL